MDPINRDDIHLLNKHSNWPRSGVEAALKTHVYADAATWLRFLRLLLMGAGIAFATAGILFFFAYNWEDLHKFAKTGLVLGVLTAVMGVALFAKVSEMTRNILLTGASVLVGVLFAVYGQIYQTGANAYDFFLGWTVFVTLWVVVSDFAPLWLLYIILINTTGVLYTEQVMRDMPEMLLLTLALALNAAFLVASLLLLVVRKEGKVPVWFTNTLALAVAYLATWGMILTVLETQLESFWHENQHYLISLTILSVGLYAAGLWHGWRRKSGFYLAVIPFCLVLIASAWLLRISEETWMLLFISLFIVGSVTLIIRNLIHLTKKSTNA